MSFVSHQPAQRRFRPPNITLPENTAKKNTIIEYSPINIDLGDDDDSDTDNEGLLGLSDSDHLQLSDPDSSPSTSPAVPLLSLESDDDTDISKDLEALERLRRSVQKNLRLRPIRSTSSLPKIRPSGTSPFAPPASAWNDFEPSSAVSDASSTASSYYTPLSESLSSPLSARYIGTRSSNSFSHPRTPSPRLTQPIDASSLFDRLSASLRPLLIDTQPPASHVASHIRHSINIAIPSLILKRCKKPGAGFQSLDALRQFITTEGGKAAWDQLLGPEGPWDGDVIVYDEDMDPKAKDNTQATSWALLPVIAPLLHHGNADYLAGGIASARDHPDMRHLIVSGGDLDFGEDPPQTGKKAGGLFQLDTQAAYHSKQLPEVENAGVSLPPSPLPMMPSAMPSAQNVNIADHSPSPSPSQVGFRRPPPPQRRVSVPGLRRLDTSSAERLSAALPKLQLRSIRPVRSATLAVPPLHTASLHPASPTHLNLVYSNHSPPGSARWSPQNQSFPSAYFTPPRTPDTPKQGLPPSPATARPDTEHPTPEDTFPPFVISTILPNFLYLGPELTTVEQVEELQELGVRRILNLAIECDDDQGLNLRQVFERYSRIPMRDTVEEENIAKGVREVCEILDDARLHSAPTYVHCKAGKSRSVTAVMAYLIHANHWTLSRAYSFVLERRKGISPNIGFVSVLMTFEEEELGGKSIGVQSSSMGDSHDGSHTDGGHGGYGVAAGNRRGAHGRESLPPVFVSQSTDGAAPGPMSAGGLINARVGDSGQEMEIKDSSGRYRHARRAPVDETTLQPMRRVSKAGLESSIYA